MQFLASFHRRVDVFEDDKSLSAHANVALRNDLFGCLAYIQNLAVLLEDVEEGVLELLHRHLLIEVINVESIVGRVLYLLGLYAYQTVNLPVTMAESYGPLVTFGGFVANIL